MVPKSIESKVNGLEERVNAIERLPPRIDGLAVEILQLREEMRVESSAMRREMATADERLSDRIEDARRDTRILHESTIGRLAVIGEGLEAVSQKVDRLDTTLSDRIDRTDAKLDLVLARLETPVARQKHKRGDKKA